MLAALGSFLQEFPRMIADRFQWASQFFPRTLHLPSGRRLFVRADDALLRMSSMARERAMAAEFGSDTRIPVVATRKPERSR
jgi:hypothetical protein